MPATNKTMLRELQKVRTSFKQLARAFERIAPVLAAASDGAGHQKRRKPVLTAKQRAALKLQGTYMGKLRHLPPSQQARVKKVRAAKGIRAAIAVARRMAPLNPFSPENGLIREGRQLDGLVPAIR